MANSITGIIQGASGHFEALNVPAGSVLPAGQIPVWASDQAFAKVTAAADGLSADVQVDSAASAGSSFTLSVTVTRSDGAVASGSASVSVLAAPPPPPVEVSSFDINQTS